jgi:predicted dehydrogenase
MSQRTRRQFLEDSMFATAAALAAGSASRAWAADEGSKSPNEKIGVACIGVRGRGADHIAGFTNRKDTEILFICDVDDKVGQQRAEQIEKAQGRKPQVVKDMRKVFDDLSVDAISTATPNHWHSLCGIWAMQAGKDVYVEKPVSHNVSEGRRMVEAARKYNRICQTGTQSRSMQGMRDAIAFLHGGGIGKLSLARGLCYKPRGPIGKLDKPLVIPPEIDYDLWCGPAA